MKASERAQAAQHRVHDLLGRERLLTAAGHVLQRSLIAVARRIAT